MRARSIANSVPALWCSAGIPLPASGRGEQDSRSWLKKILGWHAEQDLSDLFEMGGAGLDLLRERVHVAEAALERAAREDRVDAGCLVREVCHLGCSLNRVGGGE